MSCPKYDIFHKLVPLEMCIVDDNKQITYYNSLMNQAAKVEDFKNRDIKKALSIDSLENIDEFFDKIKNSEIPATECKLFGETRFIKASYQKDSKETYLVFTPFEYDWTKLNNDSLTGLPTRRLFLDRAMQVLYRCKRDNTKMAILFMDLNEFKPVNDTYGHKAGDIVLKSIASRVNTTLRKTDTVSRFGGDEFVILLSDLREGIHASLGAKRILKLIEKDIDIGEKSVSVSGSIGIAVYPDDGNDIKDLLKKADKAMYEAKQKKLGYSFYNIDQFLG